MRIIGGNCRGTILKTPNGMSTRPTQDRIRESLFNVLANCGLYDTNVLDVFAGTGAFALEALSRGASYAVAIDFRTKHIIEENSRKCHVQDALDVLGTSALIGIRRLREKSDKFFDYVFIDPPYDKGLVRSVLVALVEEQVLSKGACIIVEHSTKENLDIVSGYRMWRTKRYGSTTLTYLIYEGRGDRDANSSLSREF